MCERTARGRSGRREQVCQHSQRNALPVEVRRTGRRGQSARGSSPTCTGRIDSVSARGGTCANARVLASVRMRFVRATHADHRRPARVVNAGEAVVPETSAALARPPPTNPSAKADGTGRSHATVLYSTAWRTVLLRTAASEGVREQLGVALAAVRDEDLQAVQTASEQADGAGRRSRPTELAE